MPSKGGWNEIGNTELLAGPASQPFPDMALNKASAVTGLATMLRVTRGGLEAPDRNKN